MIQQMSCKEESSEFKLNISKYNFWYQAVRDDNVTFVQDVLQHQDKSDRKRLIDGKFEFPRNKTVDRRRFYFKQSPQKAVKYKFYRVWSIAVSCWSKRVVSTFVKYGGDPSVLDEGSNNILHLLSYISLSDRQLHERQMRSMFALLQQLLPLDTMLKMLRTENCDGFRPLEIACHFSICGLAMNMFETPGYHLVEEIRDGINVIQYYDVTEYESIQSGNRRHLSAILFLTVLDKGALSSEGTQELILSDLTQSWIKAKYRTIVPFLIAWFFLRLILIILLYLFDNTAVILHENQKLNSPLNSSMGTCIMVAASACQLCWQYPGISNESGLWVLLRQMWDNIDIYTY